MQAVAEGEKLLHLGIDGDGGVTGGGVDAGEQAVGPKPGILGFESGDPTDGGGLEGFRDITALPKITARLLKEGYTEADLQKMWGGNVVRLLKAAEDYKASLKK